VNLLAIRDLDGAALRQIMALSERPSRNRPLQGHGIALYFEKPSARTRSSMEMAAVQLGAHPVYIQREEVGLGTRETAEDVARSLACYHSVIAARVKEHTVLEQMAAVVDTPVLNMLSDSDHPLQALADLLTIRQLLGRIENTKIAFIGEANNVARSLAQGCTLLGAQFTIASPPDYSAPMPGVRRVEDPREAVTDADIVYTDVWVSMGRDEDADARRRAFASYQISPELMEAAPQAWFMHCLPARRGEEVVDEVIDGPRSAVWRQAENRMHSARGVLAWMLGVHP
jgi:ornithine carbamoyltransferase